MALSKTMLGSAAYRRMCEENRSEFVPTSVFFTHDERSKSDRASSIWVKAALVYESITGQHVNEKTKPIAHMLLLSLAKRCCFLAPQPPAAPAAAPQPPAAPAASPQPPAAPSASPQPPAAPAAAPQPPAAPAAPATRGADADPEGSDENKQMIDGIFLVVGFLSRLKKGGTSNSRDAVDESFKSTHMQDIVTDVIKLENQIPLKHLLVVVDHVEKAVHGIAGEFKALLGHLQTNERERTFEQKVQDVGGQVEQDVKDIAKEFKGAEELTKGLLGNLEKYKLEFNRDDFHKVVDCFCWYYSPFFNTKATDVAGYDPKMEGLTLLDYLHASLVPPSPERAEADGDAGGKTFLMPTARELRRSGVRFDAGKDGLAVVKFNEQSSSLRLPALVYDFKLATVARNLLAWEYVEQSKPVTRYFQMMNELVVEVADVRILRRAGLVRGGSRGAREVHELIKKIDGHATYPSVFMAMDLQIEKVRRFHDKRMKNFLVRYRPGVIWASSVAAVSVVAIIAARKKRASS